MGATFRQLWNTLMGDVPGLDLYKAQECVNYAWRDIREARRWSFLSLEGSIDIPDQITAGTAAVTQYSDVVVGDATAQAAWNVISLNLPLTLRQFRVGSGPLYQIIAYDSAGDSAANPWNANADPGALQLERAYKEATDSDAGYSIYRAYFTMPADFLTFTDLKDIQNGRTLTTTMTRTSLDEWRDPQRQSFGLAWHVAAWGGDPNNNGAPRFELWPHQLSAASLVFRYESTGIDLTETATLPARVADSLLLERAGWYAAKWALANMSRYETLQKINWTQVIVEHKLTYDEMLQKAKILDEEMSPADLSYAPEYRVRRAGNSRWAQSHAPDYDDYWNY